MKGITLFLLLGMLAASPFSMAQVYRCETAEGLVYSDLPCGETAEEIVLEGMEPEPEDGGQPPGGDARVPDGVADLHSFLDMLRSQREYQIGEIDKNLAMLRRQAGSMEFLQLDPAAQADITDRIAALESSRESILQEYASLIAEAESRLK